MTFIANNREKKRLLRNFRLLLIIGLIVNNLGIWIGITQPPFSPSWIIMFCITGVGIGFTAFAVAYYIIQSRKIKEKIKN